MPISWQMDKQNVVYLFSGVLFSHKKEWTTDTCYNTNKPWKHAKWNKSITWYWSGLYLDSTGKSLKAFKYTPVKDPFDAVWKVDWRVQK